MRCLFYLFIAIISLTSNAQQDPLTSMFWNNYAHFNPATTGLIWGHELNVTYRDQWVNTNGAPQNIFANYNTIINNKHGVGINYLYDNLGFSKSHIGNINYNYQFLINGDQKLSIGLAAGLQNIAFDGNWIPPTTADDPTLPSGSSTNLNMNTGIAYKSNRIYTGFGVTHLTESRIGAYFKSARHYYAHFGYRLSLTRKSDLDFIGIGRTDLSFSNFQIGARYIFMHKLFLGLHYRNRDSFSASAQWDFKKKFNKFSIGYCYDLTISKLSKTYGGSHEIMLGWRVF